MGEVNISGGDDTLEDTMPCIKPFSKVAVKWCDLTWPRKSPKFSLHHLRKISAKFKMVVLSLKLGIPLNNGKCHYFCEQYIFYTQVILIVVLTDVQYLQNVVFNFERDSNSQNHFSSDSHQ